MNMIKRIYCRIFQQAFHLAIPFMPYRQPKIIDSISGIPNVLKSEGKTKALVVTDESMAKLGLARKLREALEGGGIGCFVYDKTVPNPTTGNIAEAHEVYVKNSCDAIIGLGGGSSMDCAKGVGVSVARPDKTLAQLRGILKVRKRLPLLVAIPTTAGTGSETTLAALIRDTATKEKYAINDFPLIPRYAVLDPSVTLTLPPAITASTGMDALTHAVEAFIGNSTTKKTRANSINAVELIFKNLETAWADGANVEARREMLKASYSAGCAFTVSYVGYVHAIAHSLGGEYNVPHGLANAVILPMILRAYGKAARKKLAALSRAAGTAREGCGDEEAAESFISAIESMNKKFGIGKTIPQIKEEDIPKMSRLADKEANPLYPVPVLWNAKELSVFYKNLMEK